MVGCVLRPIDSEVIERESINVQANYIKSINFLVFENIYCYTVYS